MQIQVVDFQDPKSPAIFTESLKETGFGIIENHLIDKSLIQEVYKQWFEFFNKPEMEKLKYEFDAKTHAGYIPPSLSEVAKGYEKKDLKEMYHYYNNGICPPELVEITNKIKSELTHLAETLLGWIEDNTPENISSQFSMPLRDMITNSDRTLYRILHYPPLTGNEESGAVRAAAHEDINLITILPSGTADGLQVLGADGKWMDVPCNMDRIIINTGDMLDECTQGYYKATTHRVLNPTGDAAKQSRLSMPLFLHPRDEVRLSARHTRLSYAQERYGELGLAEEEEN